LLVKIKGISSHAETIPMEQRDDALLKALPVIQYVSLIAQQVDKNMVGTVGDLKVKPGAFNVVPGEVILKLEFRSINKLYLEKAIIMLKNRISLIHGSVIMEVSKSIPVKLDNRLLKIISRICDNKKVSYTKLPSFASHDARETAKKLPSALICVPSKDGISHSPKEYTSYHAIEKDISILLITIKKLDKA